MGAKPVGAEEIILGPAMDRKGPARMVAANDAFLPDVGGGTGIDPGVQGRLHGVTSGPGGVCAFAPSGEADMHQRIAFLRAVLPGA